MTDENTPPEAVRNISRHLDNRVTLESGIVHFNGRERFAGPATPSFKVVVVLTGETVIQVSTHPVVRVTGPAVFVLFTQETTLRSQTFSGGETYRFALIDLDADIVRTELGVEPASLFDMAGMPAGLAVRPADKTVQAVAAQILACPVGDPHNMYRLAKAFELAALAIEAIRPRAQADVRGRLSAADLERVHSARDHLLAAMADPPDVRELARMVGFNVRKLNMAFRMAFGATPYAYLQEQRLQTAYRLLASGEKTVGETAHAVGYGPTHLATLFSKRFGMTPSELIPLSSLAHCDRSFELP